MQSCSNFVCRYIGGIGYGCQHLEAKRRIEAKLLAGSGVADDGKLSVITRAGPSRAAKSRVFTGFHMDLTRFDLQIGCWSGESGG